MQGVKPSVGLLIDRRQQSQKGDEETGGRDNPYLGEGRPRIAIASRSLQRSEGGSGARQATFVSVL